MPSSSFKLRLAADRRHRGPSTGLARGATLPSEKMSWLQSQSELPLVAIMLGMVVGMLALAVVGFAALRSHYSRRRQLAAPSEFDRAGSV